VVLSDMAFSFRRQVVNRSSDALTILVGGIGPEAADLGRLIRKQDLEFRFRAPRPSSEWVGRPSTIATLPARSERPLMTEVFLTQFHYIGDRKRLVQWSIAGKRSFDVPKRSFFVSLRSNFVSK
jgi:hypothetical protein